LNRFIRYIGLAALWQRGRYALAVGVLCIAGSLVAGTARADLLLFSFKSGSDSASWEQSSNPTPFGITSDGIGVDVQNGTETTAFAGTESFPYVAFDTPAGDGGFRTQTGDFVTTGPQLFTGTEANPIFSAGTYDLSYLNLSDDAFVPGLLTVTVESASVVPEPASWALFCVGLLGLGLVRGVRTRIGIRRCETAV
jgi:hypothetical protein